MRSLYCVMVFGWIGLVLSFQLAPLHRHKRRLISIPNTCVTNAKFQSTVVPKLQPIICYSSVQESSSLLTSEVDDSPLELEASMQGDQHDSIKDYDGIIYTTKNVTVKWSNNEITALRELVTKQLQPVWNDVAGATVTPKIDWVSIGKELGRSRQQCRHKWKSIEFENHARFTAEEDALILQRVKKWGNKGKGLWTTLSIELHRSPSAVRGRWLIKRTETLKNIVWTEELDAALWNAYHTEKLRTRRVIALWERVSIRLQNLDWIAPAELCQSRFHNYVKYGHRKTIVWTPELVESLKDMRAQGMRWKDIGTTLNILPHQQCRAKWISEYKKTLKKGPFTPEEDALIQQKVTEWNILHEDWKTMGLWTSLEKLLGRSASTLRNRWSFVLSLKT